MTGPGCLSAHASPGPLGRLPGVIVGVVWVDASTATNDLFKRERLKPGLINANTFYDELNGCPPSRFSGRGQRCMMNALGCLPPLSYTLATKRGTLMTHKWIESMWNQIEEKTRIFALSCYLPGRFDQRDVYILTSSPRSGSTLLGNILGAIPDSCVLFEPLHLRNVPEAEAVGFSWRTFVPREENWIEGEEYLKRVFEGRVINSWTAREISFRNAYKSKRLIIKFVRANRLLPWICERFEIPAPILLLRHPCAVIASQLNYGWKNAKRPNVPPYLEEYPIFQASLVKTEGDEEFLAALWALDQLPILMDQAPRKCIIITYEELILHPERTLLKIRDKWDVEINIDDALSRLRKPSSVVSHSGVSGVNGWKNVLSEKQVSRVLSTVNSFGLSFYSDKDEADYGELYSKELAKNIQKAGIG